MPASSAAAREQIWNQAQLQNRVQTPAFRMWRYRLPAVVLGYSQLRLMQEVDARTGLEVLRRDSGGGAVLTGPWMLGLSVALPPQHALLGTSLTGSYQWLGALIAHTLQECNVPAEAVSPQDVRDRANACPTTNLSWACFGGLSPWEVLSNGRKIAGLAQVRRSNGVLLVGGVLLNQSPWELLCQTLSRPPCEAKQLAETTTHCLASSGNAFDPALFEKRLYRGIRTCLQQDTATRRKGLAPSSEVGAGGLA